MISLLLGGLSCLGGGWLARGTFFGICFRLGRGICIVWIGRIEASSRMLGRTAAARRLLSTDNSADSSQTIVSRQSPTKSQKIYSKYLTLGISPAPIKKINSQHNESTQVCKGSI